MRLHSVCFEEEEMTRIFLGLYRWFSRHRTALYSILAGTLLLMLSALPGLRLDEDITAFLPSSGDSAEMADVFRNLKVSDRFVFMFSQKEGGNVYGLMEEAADSLMDMILQAGEGTMIKDAVISVDDEVSFQAADFVYRHLPVFLTDDAYSRLDSLQSGSGMLGRMLGNREALLSPAGSYIKDYVLRDPFGLALPVIASLQGLAPADDYQLIDGHIYSSDGNTLLCFITPAFGTGDTGNNDMLVTLVEDSIEKIREDYPSVDIQYFAGPAVGVYNARQIKKDTLLTTVSAVVLIALFIFLSFRRRGSVFFIFLPVLYGILFSLSIVSVFIGHISAIAVGTGAVVLGIALSYSIHVIAHQMHVRTVEQLVRELVFPLTVGSLTTIGAFTGLLFTSSPLLHDFGLFAALTLVGTTLFTLVFLPHFLTPMYDVPQTPLLRMIDRINGYGYERNRWLVAFIVLLSLVCLFLSGNVGFNADMMSLSYMPDHLQKARERLEKISGNGAENILFVSTGDDIDEADSVYVAADTVLDSLVQAGKIRHYASAREFVIPYGIQRERIERWNSYWTDERVAAVLSSAEKAAVEAGFREGAFSGLEDMLAGEYSPVDYSADSLPDFLDSWVCRSDARMMLVSNVSIDPEKKGEVYRCFEGKGTVIFDRSWFAGESVIQMSGDLDLILWIASLIVFAGLCLSYRRLELAALSFLPMLVTWVIITGLMALAGLEFNIVNIVISTFIFGIGDDFSIFITDGLVRRYATGKDMLAAHRTAIFFSAFTIVAGMGAMIAAKHPALHSVGAISLLGMLAVLLVAYTMQPLLFRLFVSGPVSRGRHPYTLRGTFLSLLLWLEFLIACIVTILVMLVLLPVPMSMYRKQLAVRYVAYLGCRCVIFTAPIARAYIVNAAGEDFSRPAVVVGNHQSFLDIVWMMAISPRLLIVAKGWVRKVPVFYPVARFLGFYYTDAGYEAIAEEYGRRVPEGWSLAVFPEGTRETDGRIHRFHKGAFYIACRLGLDIVPAVFYGNGRIFPKGAPLNMAEGISVAEILPRISTRGESYKLLAKRVRTLIEDRYSSLEQAYSTMRNPYWSWALTRSMLYKGTDAERSTRALLKRKDFLASLDESLPRCGRILHLGCGLGQVDILLKMLSPQRQIIAVDGDAEKIDIASHNYLCAPGLEFICADPDTAGTSDFDAVILPDWTVVHPCSGIARQSSDDGRS